MKHPDDSIRENMSIDDNNDVIELFGIKYSGEVFRKFAIFLKPGQLFRFENRDNGIITLTNIPEEKQKA